MEELKLGLMTFEEIAAWFGIKESTLKKSIKKTLENKNLEEYCDYQIIRGKGIEVKQIYKPVYVKNPSYIIIKEEFCKTWSSTGLDTCSHVGKQIYANKTKELAVNSYSSVERLTRMARNELYGKPHCKNSRGTKGTCKYIWCKKDDEGNPVFLSDKEEKIKKELLNLYFNNTDEIDLMLQDMVDKNEITAAEAWEQHALHKKLTSGSYLKFLKIFRDKTGVQLIKGTLINDQLSFEEEGEED